MTNRTLVIIAIAALALLALVLLVRRAHSARVGLSTSPASVSHTNEIEIGGPASEMLFGREQRPAAEETR